MNEKSWKVNEQATNSELFLMIMFVFAQASISLKIKMCV